MRAELTKELPARVSAAFAAIAVVFAVIANVTYMLSQEQQLPLFIGLILAAAFLHKRLGWGRLGLYLDLLAAGLSLFVGFYAALNWQFLISRAGIPTPTNVVVGVIAILLVIEATRRIAGLPLVFLIGFFLLYNYLGPFLPGALNHRVYGVPRLVSQLYITRQGIFSLPLATAFRYVVVFIIFGNMLEVSGFSNFFMKLASLLAGRFTGGVGLVAVVASGFAGSITGSPSANVVITGTTTIPAMKRTGFSPPMAGAIEALASTGGQFMPPVMGAAAFVMAEMLGLPYIRIAQVALIPAILYFFCCGATVRFYAARMGIKKVPRENLPAASAILKEIYVLLPIVLIVVLLVKGYSPVTSGMWAIVGTFLVSLLNKDTRIGVRVFYRILVKSGRGTIIVAVASAAAGVVTGLINLTGLGPRLADLLVVLAGNNVLLLLAMTMVVSIIMGMGMPTVPVYIVLATLVAPALVNLHMEPVIAHFFIFYFGGLSMITPPVAMASYAAAAIAEDSPDRVGWTAFKIAIPVFILPYFFIYRPALLTLGTPLEVVQSLFMGVTGIVAFAAGMQGYLARVCQWWERLLILAAALLLITPGNMADLAGLVLFALILFKQLLEGRSRVFPAGDAGPGKTV